MHRHIIDVSFRDVLTVAILLKTKNIKIGIAI